MTRRDLLKRSALMSAMITTGMLDADAFTLKKKGLKIGACDWSIGKRADVTGVALAKEIGLHGIQVDLGTKENDLHVRKKEIQSQYLAEAKKHDIKIASLALGALNHIPYKSEPETEQWVWDSIDVAKAFDVKVVLLAFFAKNDLRNDDAGKKEVVRRLKQVAPKAEKMGITLGIESYLSAEEHMEIIDAVGSNNVRVFYDFRNSADAGYDVIKEFKWLGKQNICELHMKENGMLLSKGTLDWQKICDMILNMDYRGDGWMQIEWSVPKDGDIVACYKENLAFLRDKMA